MLIELVHVHVPLSFRQLISDNFTSVLLLTIHSLFSFFNIVLFLSILKYISIYFPRLNFVSVISLPKLSFRYRVSEVTSLYTVPSISLFINLPVNLGTAVAQWLRCWATNRKVAGSIPDGVIAIFNRHKILPIALWPWGRLSL